MTVIDARHAFARLKLAHACKALLHSGSPSGRSKPAAVTPRGAAGAVVALPGRGVQASPARPAQHVVTSSAPQCGNPYALFLKWYAALGADT